MELFHPTTTPQEARALTATCFQAIAAGWSILHFKKSGALDIHGNPEMITNMPAMIASAADIAAMLTQAVDARLDLPAGFECDGFTPKGGGQ